MLFFFLQPSKVDYESGSETEKEIIQSHKEEQIPLVPADQEKGKSRPCSHSVIANIIIIIANIHSQSCYANLIMTCVDSIGKEAEIDGSDILPEDYEITEKFEMVNNIILPTKRSMPCAVTPQVIVISF